jgi:hypothetical protein
MLPRLSLVLGALLVLTLTAPGDPPAPERLPVGTWTIEFANGVVEVCEVRQDGTATVAEPKRTSAGKVTAREGSFVLTFDDDRVERWTAVGKRMVVEHWFPATQFPGGTPVLGIAHFVR